MLESAYLTSDGSAPPLRIGLLLDSYEVPEWIAHVVSHIQSSNFARTELVILNGIAHETVGPALPRRPLPVRVWRTLSNKRRRRQFLFKAYERWDQKRYAPEHDPFTPRDIGGMISGVKKIVVHPVVKGFTHRFPSSDVEAIRSEKLDVMLRFGFNIIRGDILSAARYGMWSYHHGDNDWYRGGPPHFWEMMERHPVSGVLLQVLSEELDAGLVLCKSNIATLAGMSLVRNHVGPYWTGSLFVIRKLNELHRYGWDYLKEHSIPNRPQPGRDRIYRAPTNLQMVRFLAPRVADKLVGRVVAPDAIAHWRMAVRNDPARFLSLDRPPDMSGFRWSESPPGHFWADPFLHEKNGSTRVYFEDYLYDEEKAIIASAEVLGDGSFGPVETALKRPYHLSYPLVFEHDGETFMMPETGDNKTVELYRCVGYPSEWKLEKTLFEGAAAWDPTLWIDNGRFWWFVTLLDPPGAGPQLYLFHSTSLTGEWKWHRANPICTDERRARAAGKLFRMGDKLIRPSQDCTITYGYSFSWNVVNRLTPDEYDETPALTVLPGWAPKMMGTHTYNRTSRFEIVDAKFASRLSAHRRSG